MQLDNVVIRGKVQLVWVAIRTHCEEFGSRSTGTGGSSFVPVQIQPDFSLSHLLEEISTYFLKICAA